MLEQGRGGELKKPKICACVSLSKVKSGIDLDFLKV